ncbi:putative alpha/beta hydrolase [Pseudohyphozyma bogoriensis]|nr:putative alpha/beta hydrolase [Pseudohyphozyma bogoriensis]
MSKLHVDRIPITTKSGRFQTCYAANSVDPSRPTLVFINAYATSVDLYAPHFTFWDQADLVLEVLETLGIDKFFLLGTSQGGFIACRVAIRGGDRVQGIIACGSTFEAEVTYNEFFQELMDEFATEKDDFVVSEEYRKWYIHMGWGDTVGPDLEKFWRDTLDVRFSGREGQRRLWQITTNLAERDSIRNRVQEIRCPVYILHGSEDVAIPVDLIKTHFGWLTRSSHKEMHVIHGGTHYLTQSSPKEVKSFIVKLLK